MQVLNIFTIKIRIYFKPIMMTIEPATFNFYCLFHLTKVATDSGM